jgi:hypothetical protein
MANPTDFGLVEFVLLSNQVYTEECALEEVMEFLLGEKPFWRFDLDPDDQGVKKFVYVPWHAISEIIWHDNAVARRRREKGL